MTDVRKPKPPFLERGWEAIHFDDDGGENDESDDLIDVGDDTLGA